MVFFLFCLILTENHVFYVNSTKTLPGSHNEYTHRQILHMQICIMYFLAYQVSSMHIIQNFL